MTATYMSHTKRKWATDESIADPKVLPKVPGWGILIRPWAAPEKTAGGIIKPQEFVEDEDFLFTVGRVVVIGDLAYQGQDKGGAPRFPTGPWCKVGDYVVHDKYVNTRFTYKGVKYLLLNDDQVRLVIKDPKDFLDV